jgi:hypothetical protein
MGWMLGGGVGLIVAVSWPSRKVMRRTLALTYHPAV